MEKAETKQQQPIELYAAVREMQRLSLAGGEFSFSFVKYDRQRRTGGDIANVSRARLRHKAASDKIEHSDYKLFFTDLDSGKPRVCWQVLIIEFNGQKLIL
jgi:hypothetical protein